MVTPVRVTEQLAGDPDKLQVEDENETDPVPDWVHVTVSLVTVP